MLIRQLKMWLNEIWVKLNSTHGSLIGDMRVRPHRAAAQDLIGF